MFEARYKLSKKKLVSIAIFLIYDTCMEDSCYIWLNTFKLLTFCYALLWITGIGVLQHLHLVNVELNFKTAV